MTEDAHFIADTPAEREDTTVATTSTLRVTIPTLVVWNFTLTDTLFSMVHLQQHCQNFK